MITLEKLCSRITRQAQLAEMPGIARIQVAQTTLGPTDRGLTVILRADGNLGEAITACRPYTFPGALHMAAAHIIALVRPWLASGELTLIDSELVALSLSDTSMWHRNGVTGDEATKLITVPQITAPGGEQWRDHLFGLPAMFPPDEAAGSQYFDIVVAPERVQLTGRQGLEQFARVSRGWNVLGTDDAALTAAVRYMHDAVDRARTVARAA